MTANVLIDIEVLYYLRRHEPPIHRYLHTYVGGIAMGLLAGLLIFGIVQVSRRIGPARWLWVRRLELTPRCRLLSQSLVAGTIGGVSHILLDSFMHHDMNPLWPVIEGNALAGAIGVPILHIGLALTGVFGLVLWLLLRES